jgi:hypothetical protein
MLLLPRFYSALGFCCRVVMLRHERRLFSNIWGLCGAWGVTETLTSPPTDGITDAAVARRIRTDSISSAPFLSPCARRRQRIAHAPIGAPTSCCCNSSSSSVATTTGAVAFPAPWDSASSPPTATPSPNLRYTWGPLTSHRRSTDARGYEPGAHPSLPLSIPFMIRLVFFLWCSTDVDLRRCAVVLVGRSAPTHHRRIPRGFQRWCRQPPQLWR